jgi:hypothetical protein
MLSTMRPFLFFAALLILCTCLSAQCTDPALSAFQTSITVSIDSGKTQGSASFAVPSGQRFVIEFLTTSPSGLGGVFNYTVTTSVSGTTVSFLNPSGTVRIYADGDTAIMVQVNRSITSSAGSLIMATSGRLVALPPPPSQ